MNKIRIILIFRIKKERGMRNGIKRIENRS